MISSAAACDQMQAMNKIITVTTSVNERVLQAYENNKPTTTGGRQTQEQLNDASTAFAHGNYLEACKILYEIAARENLHLKSIELEN